MIILFCGIPGAGKTTIARKLVRKLDKVGTVKLFMSDALRTPVYKKVVAISVNQPSPLQPFLFRLLRGARGATRNDAWAKANHFRA